jgi:hypothetical protein
MDKKTKNNVVWSLDTVLRYVKIYGEDSIFDPSHCLMHLETAMNILKQEEILKNTQQ